MAKALVTGGVGFIGAVLTHELVNAGWEVSVLDKDAPKDQRRVSSESVCYQCFDLKKPIVESVLNGVDAVFHCAGLNSQFCESDYLTAWGENVTSTFNLVNTIKHIYKSESFKPVFIYPSSLDIFEGSEIIPINGFTEVNIAKPLSVYATTKYLAEKIISQAFCYTDFPFMCLRFGNAVGAYCKIIDDRDNLFANLSKSIVHNKTVFVDNTKYATKDGSAVREFIDVVDIVDALIAAFEYKANDAYAFCDILHLGTGLGVSENEVLQYAKSLGLKDLDIAPDKRQAARLIAGSGLAEKILQWRPKISWQESLKETIRALKGKTS